VSTEVAKPTNFTASRVHLLVRTKKQMRYFNALKSIVSCKAGVHIHISKVPRAFHEGIWASAYLYKIKLSMLRDQRVAPSTRTERHSTALSSFFCLEGLVILESVWPALAHSNRPRRHNVDWYPERLLQVRGSVQQTYHATPRLHSSWHNIFVTTAIPNVSFYRLNLDQNNKMMLFL
jgi:hypothetical protein